MTEPNWQAVAKAEQRDNERLRGRIKELEDELSDVQPILGVEQQTEIRRVTDKNSGLRIRVDELESAIEFAVNNMLTPHAQVDTELKIRNSWHRLFDTMKNENTTA